MSILIIILNPEKCHFIHFFMVTGNVFFKSLFRSHMHYTIGKDMWQLEIVKIISMYKTVETVSENDAFDIYSRYH